MDTYIEILGFTDQNITDYVASILDQDKLPAYIYALPAYIYPLLPAIWCFNMQVKLYLNSMIQLF